MENINSFLLNSSAPSERSVKSCNCAEKLLSLQDYENNERFSNLFLAPELQAQWLRPLQSNHIGIANSTIKSPTTTTSPCGEEMVEEVGSCTDHHHHMNSSSVAQHTHRISTNEDEDAVESATPIQGKKKNGVIIQADHICSHPLFMRFLTGHIECSKVGVADQSAIAQLDQLVGQYRLLSTKSIPIGSHPDLDQFMVAYCSMLDSHKEEMSAIFKETGEFLKTQEKSIQALRMGYLGELKTSVHCACPQICSQAMDNMESKLHATIYAMMEEGIQPPLTSFQISEISQVAKELKEEINAQKEKKYSRLPEDATMILQEWWDKNHEINPYPSKSDKLEFVRWTGLEPKQVENWFSNQRKKSCGN